MKTFLLKKSKQSLFPNQLSRKYSFLPCNTRSEKHFKYAIYVRFQVLMVVSMKMAVIWVVEPGRLVIQCPDDGGSKQL
jgi:hypothetical protein